MGNKIIRTEDSLEQFNNEKIKTLKMIGKKKFKKYGQESEDPTLFIYNAKGHKLTDN